MIHLDTNYLLGLLVKGSLQALEVDGWLATGELLAASTIAWTEFLNGPMTATEVGRAEAVMAAELFNKTGRRRGSRFDCLVAATAAVARAEIATVNQADFKPFLPYGVKLASPAQPLTPAAGPSS